jgi:signal transduction histidine kinase
MQALKGTILMVDDTLANLQVLTKILKEHAYKIRPADSGKLALKSVQFNLPDLILLDIKMPEMDGYEVCEKLKADDKTRDIPVIFISALNEVFDKMKAFSIGGVDYISKPFQAEEVLARIETHLALRNLQKKVEAQNVQLKQEIHERKQAEEKFKQAKEEADSANRAKNEFLANMSHEIRTPMTAIITFSDILAAKITDKQHKTYLNSIQTAGKNLLTLINDILDLSKIEAGQLDIQYEPVYPQIIFAELQQIFNLKIAEKNLELIMEIDESLPNALFLDKTRLRQVLLNLIGNAVKFTNSGYIKLCANNIYIEDDRSKVDLIIAVEDSGIGIPAEQQALIFESFRQQDGRSTRQYNGTGLGLAITKRLVEMMNGHIEVESNPGKGSRFEIALYEVKVAATQLAVMQDNTSGSVADTPQITTAEVDNTLNPEDIANLPELQNKLKQEVMPLWEEANIMMEMDIVAELAEKMIELGYKYNIPVFIRYGESLLESTQVFNIGYIQKVLKEFPDMVKPLIMVND